MIISQFWRDLAAGKPLGDAWRRKDAAIALQWLEEAPLEDTIGAWLQLTDAEQRRLLAQLYAA
jgi:hypothetical protein